MKTYRNFIGNEWIQGSSGRTIDVENPADRSIIARVQRSNAEDVDAAVAAARRAFTEWSSAAPGDRAVMMRRLADVLERHAGGLCDTITSEIGMPRQYAYDYHVDGAVKAARIFADIAERYVYEEENAGSIIIREPFGVVGGITPWNYPLTQVTTKVFAAIAAGNTVVVKPSQSAPLSCLKLAECVLEAGLPAGVFNVVTGTGAEIGTAIAAHPGIDALSFTGSYTAGVRAAEAALSNVKKVALELGGKSPLVLLRGGDEEAAVKYICSDVFMNSGQTCCALTRFIIPHESSERIEQLLAAEARNYVTGDPMSPDTVVGPLVSRSAYNKVRSYISSGVSEGARIIAGGVPPEMCYENEADGQDFADTHGRAGADGYYVEPTVFMDVTGDMKIAREEIFGPVISVLTYETEEEAIRMANDTDYGLAGCVFGPEEAALTAARQLRAGYISVNGGYQGDDAPFGGYKASGVGREGGIYGFEEFLEVKVIGKCE